MDIPGSFAVNRFRILAPTIQYSLLFFKDRVLFIKIGGQFADTRYSLVAVVPELIFGFLGYIWGYYLIGRIGSHIYLLLGAICGAYIGSVVANRVLKPSPKRASVLKNLTNLSEDELLNRDKGNFVIPFEEISDIDLQKSQFGFFVGPRVGIIAINGNKYDIAPGQSYDECLCLVDSLLTK